MMVNEFGYRNYDCGASCQCIYQTALQPHCMIDGKDVLEQFEYENGNMDGHYAGDCARL